MIVGLPCELHFKSGYFSFIMWEWTCRILSQGHSALKHPAGSCYCCRRSDAAKAGGKGNTLPVIQKQQQQQQQNNRTQRAGSRAAAVTPDCWWAGCNGCCSSASLFTIRWQPHVKRWKKKRTAYGRLSFPRGERKCDHFTPGWFFGESLVKRCGESRPAVGDVMCVECLSSHQ